MILEWLLTFAVHSTLWCGLAWLFLRARKNNDARQLEMVWLTAVAASFVTPTVAMLSNTVAVWHVPAPGLSAGAAAAPEFWLRLAGWLWVAVAFAMVLHLTLRLRALDLRLRHRQRIADPQLHRTLVGLCEKADAPAPILTQSSELSSPIAFGIGRQREICVPTNIVDKLDDDETRALLGHELAHHLRRDTLRLSIMNALQAMFFFQPLLRLAGRDLQMAAEEECDAWAADQLDDRYAMASCLTEVATWIVARDEHLPAACMGRHRSQLAHRVHRLTADRAGGEHPSRAVHVLSGIAILFVASVFAPSLDQASPREEHNSERSSHDGGGHDGRGEHR